MDYDAIIIGGGPAGMMAALACGDLKVGIIERNECFGKKLRISGKGRCNLTNAKESQEFFKAIRRNAKFFHSAFARFNQHDLMQFFEKRGLPLKIERGDRVFPVSDRAQDVVDLLESELRTQGVHCLMKKRVQSIRAAGAGYILRCDKDHQVTAENVVLACGGASYPGTGSSGDGYRLAEQLGLPLVSPRPALVPLIVEAPWLKDLQGLTLKNVRLSIQFPKKKKPVSYFGDMLITHFGISGPIVLTASDACAAYWQEETQPLQASIDFKPALSEELLDRRLLREIQARPKGQVNSLLRSLLPKRLVDVFLYELALDGSLAANQLTAGDRRILLEALKHWPLRLEGTRPLSEAIVTAGGVEVKAIDPKTMMVKERPGLYVCGELLDLHADTGGYNLQIAFSTGVQVGRSIRRRKEELHG